MSVARTHCIALVGVQGHIVEVETHLGGGAESSVTLVGLPDAALREARDRTRAALINSGEKWPSGSVVISLSPASLPKSGSLFDLAIAGGIMAASGEVPLDRLDGTVLIAELGLNGRARPVLGVLPAVAAAAEQGFARFVVAHGNAAEARLVPDIDVIAVDTLADLCLWLRGGTPPEPPKENTPESTPTDEHAPDLADVLGQPVARRAVEIAAAGGHNLMMLGPPGTGKSLLAERLPTVLPRLRPEEALEATAIHSVSGMLPANAPLITLPPFAAPHHSATRASIIGGGSGHPTPGWVTKAHRGVLFVDEAPQFSRGVLDSLREPLERGEVVLARAASTVTLPARFQLIMAANPCPCAKPGSLCTCPAGERRRYLSRISGPLLDRIDLKVELQPVARAELLADRTFAEPSVVVAERVLRARERVAKRLSGTPWSTNAAVPGARLRRDFPVEPAALRILGRAMDLGQISARGVDRALRVAWTLADLADRERPGEEEAAYAFALWSGQAW